MSFCYAEIRTDQRIGERHRALDEFCKGPSLSSRAQTETCRIRAYGTNPRAKRGKSVIEAALIVDGFIGRLFGQSEFS
jgi:hypothetical protein